jgi:LacI family transcriptional regulator/LacI family asc operon transcriptional repressor
MNIYDIASMAGVSIATVSRVLNGSEKVSEKTRARVMAVIEKEQYTPNLFARGLDQGTIHSVGILVPDISNLYMSDCVSVLEKNLEKKGYSCILACSGYEKKSKVASVQMLLDKMADALILVGSTYAGNGTAPEETDYIRSAAEKVPVFLVNGFVEGSNVYCNICNDRQAVYEAASLLISHGRKNILFLTNSGSYSALQKLQGYRECLARNGIPVREDLILHPGARIHAVRDYLLNTPLPPFDAVICAEDFLAVGAVKYAHARGIRIPEDLEIIGYNNSSLAVSCEPELTSIDSRTEKLCTSTVDLLVRRLETLEPIPQAADFSGILTIRQTTLPEKD